MRRIAIVVVLAALGCNGNGDPTGQKARAATAGRTTPGSTSSGGGTGATTSGTTGAVTTGAGTSPVGTGTGNAPGGPTPGSSNGTGGISGVVPGAPAFGLFYDPAEPASRYSLYVPTGYSGAPTGVVLAFHGVEGTNAPDGWFQVCATFANKDRFIVVAPYGDTTDGGSGAWTQPFAREILDLVRQRYNVDDRRTYMAAISGGCLPGIRFALTSGPSTYNPPRSTWTVKAGYQSEFAGVGFCAPAYTTSDPEFMSAVFKNSTSLGFKPSMWSDYGQTSNDKARATQFQLWATTQRYDPITLAERANEGHPPVAPFAYAKQMFDQFAASAKP